MTITSKERVITQIEHKETDFIPYHLTFDPNSDVEARLDQYYGNSTWRSQIDNAIFQLPLPSNGLTVDLEADKYWRDAYGSVWRLDLRPYELVEPVIKEPRLDNFRMPSVDEVFDLDWEQRALRLIEEHKNQFVVASFGFGLFERSWVLRGFENVLIDIVTNLNFYEELLGRLADHHMKIVERLLNLPVDGIWFSDDWGYQQGVLVGAERWRKLFKPHFARFYQRTHEAGKYVLTHCCGSIEEILPDVIEIGLDVYQSVQPEAKNTNPYDLKRKYGNQLCFWGGLGSQSNIPFGTTQEIRAEVHRLCCDMGKGGGYILGPAKEIQPETPTENAAAVVEAFLEQTGVTIAC
jgi:uroporphyrinogen decarboxylase